MNYSFGKNEKLCSRKDIQTLFEKGEKFVSYPFFFIYNLTEKESKLPPKVLISVSKKKFNHATKRNRIKRICREAYRLNKSQLLESTVQTDRELHFSINYIANEEKPFNFVSEKMKTALKQLSDEIKKHIG